MGPGLARADRGPGGPQPAVAPVRPPATQMARAATVQVVIFGAATMAQCAVRVAAAAGRGGRSTVTFQAPGLDCHLPAIT